MNDDVVLLRRYAEEKSEEAFAELVGRHLDLVYSAALRRLGGDAHGAADVAQRVFTTLARNAGILSRHTGLTAWLYTATRNAAIDLIRAERSRRVREQEASNMQISADAVPDAAWEKLRPVIDEAMDALNERDREAVLLRFFEGKPLAEVGAQLTVSENAARMRVDRALEKLRAALAGRGVTSTGAALGVALANQATTAAPVGLAASVTGAALSSAATTSGGVAAVKILSFMSTTKIAAGVAGIVAIAAATFAVRQQKAVADLRTEMSALREQATTTAALREENRKLATEVVAVRDTAAAEHNELVKMRAEREAFLKTLAAKSSSIPRVDRPSTPEGPGDNTVRTSVMTPMDLMANVGRATPSATAQTIAWGLQHADYKTVAEALVFEPADRAKLEALIAGLPEAARAKYNTPEEIVALIMAGASKPIAGVQMLSREQPNPDTEIHHAEWQYQDGELRKADITFHRDGENWKQVVSATTVDRVIAYVKGLK
jgi:RNA polymerase sigma factor (sigma-70 family)